MPLSPIPGTLVFGRRRLIKALRPSSGFPPIPPPLCPPADPVFPWGPDSKGKGFTAPVGASFVVNTPLATQEPTATIPTSFTVTIV